MNATPKTMSKSCAIVIAIAIVITLIFLVVMSVHYGKPYRVIQAIWEMERRANQGYDYSEPMTKQDIQFINEHFLHYLQLSDEGGVVGNQGRKK